MRRMLSWGAWLDFLLLSNLSKLTFNVFNMLFLRGFFFFRYVLIIFQVFRHL